MDNPQPTRRQFLVQAPSAVVLAAAPPAEEAPAEESPLAITWGKGLVGNKAVIHRGKQPYTTALPFEVKLLRTLRKAMERAERVHEIHGPACIGTGCFACGDVQHLILNLGLHISALEGYIDDD